MNEKKVWGVIFLVLGLVIVGYFSLRSLTLGSAIDGQVTLYNSPLPHLKVERQYHWGWSNEDGRDQAMTDHEGHFHLNPITRSSFWPALIPHDASITEHLFLTNEGTTYELWLVTKHDYHENSENALRPINLTCDLSKPYSEGEQGKGICTLSP